MGTLVYGVAKYVNNIIIKYRSKQLMINSTNDFINICKAINTPTNMVSLDV